MMYLLIMGRLIISETEKKNILSLYEATNVVPPPSESVLVDNKNPFKYPEYESARRTYSSDLKDGDMFYILTGFSKFAAEQELNKNFRKGLYNKTVRIDDNIYTFLKTSINESTNFGGGGTISLGSIEIIKNNDSPKFSSIKAKLDTTTNKFQVFFVYDAASANSKSISIQSISDLYSQKYKEEVTDKSVVGNMPDEYFEIRKVQRQKTDF